jgi:DNA-binding beta-propeller fold protein YncE
LIAAHALALSCTSGSAIVVPSASAPSDATSAVPTRSPNDSATETLRRTPPQDPYRDAEVTKVEAEIVDLHGGDVGYLGVSRDSVWVATSGGLLRIDPKTLRVEEIDHASRFGLDASMDAVWTTEFDPGTVARFDPAKKTPATVVELSGNPDSLVIFEDSVWVAQHRGGSVTRLDASTGSVLATVEVGPEGFGGPHGIGADKFGVWVGIPRPESRSVVRIDPSTNAVVATIKTQSSACGGIALDPDAVWVSSCYDDHFAIRIDPRTNLLVAEIDIGGYNGRPLLIDGYPWYPVDHRLVRVDPKTNQIDRIVEFARDFSAFGSTMGFGSVWVGDFEGHVARFPITALADR